MQPIYFLPECSKETLGQNGTVDRRILAARGLASQFSDVRDDEICGPTNSIGETPGGKAGCYLAYQTIKGAPPARLNHYPEEIDWSDAGQFWIGIFKNSLPTEEDLRRRKQFNGYYAELSDGKRWVVPVIRRPNDTTELPRACKIQADGRYTETIKEAYRSYWEASKEVAGWFFEGGGQCNDMGHALRLACDALSLNYRFTLAEQNAAGIVDTENLMFILAHTVDVLGANELAAKKN